MTNLETTILNIKSLEKPYDFFKNVSEKLSAEELALFQDIWEKASDVEIWRVHDLILACKIAHTFIRNNYDLDENAIGPIVGAISYQWR